jgi:hypothetical protein
MMHFPYIHPLAGVAAYWLLPWVAATELCLIPFGYPWKSRP